MNAFAQDEDTLDDLGTQRAARIMIERMSQEGRSQREITAEVASLLGGPAGGRHVRSWLGRLMTSARNLG